MTARARSPVDQLGQVVEAGDTVRIVALSGDWFDELPSDEKARIESMVGAEFVVERIDEFGQPWVSRSWGDAEHGTCEGHSVALEASEMLLVRKRTPTASR